MFRLHDRPTNRPTDQAARQMPTTIPGQKKTKKKNRLLMFVVGYTVIRSRRRSLVRKMHRLTRLPDL